MPLKKSLGDHSKKTYEYLKKMNAHFFDLQHTRFYQKNLLAFTPFFSDRIYDVLLVKIVKIFRITQHINEIRWKFNIPFKIIIGRSILLLRTNIFINKLKLIKFEEIFDDFNFLIITNFGAHNKESNVIVRICRIAAFWKGFGIDINTKISLYVIIEPL